MTPPLVLVGCGYIGTALARAALSRERPVYALVRSAERAETLRRIGLTKVVTGDVVSKSWHGELPCSDVDVVFSVSSGGDSVAYARTYVDGMNSALAWASRGKVHNFVYTSSTGVYPQSEGATVDESSPVGGDTRSDVLVETENLLLNAAKRKGSGVRRAFALRFGGLYGPGRHYMLDTLRRGESVFAGRGDFRINYLHRDDAVDSILCALNLPDSAPGGVFNITDGRPERKDEIASWLAGRLGLERPRFDADIVTARSARRGTASPDRIVSIAKAKEVLSWRPAYADYREGYSAILRGEN